MNFEHKKMAHKVFFCFSPMTLFPGEGAARREYRLVALFAPRIFPWKGNRGRIEAPLYGKAKLDKIGSEALFFMTPSSRRKWEFCLTLPIRSIFISFSPS